MTQEQIETLLTLLLLLVTLNTTAILLLSNRFNNYATLSSLYDTNSTLTANSTTITKLSSDIATLQTSIGLVNKLSKLLDTNIKNLSKDDLLLFDGDRWTNIKPSKLGITGENGVTSLELLQDVYISNKSNGQALVWSNADGKWINSTVSGSGSNYFDATKMWEELSKNSTNLINPSHITGSLTLSGLTVNGSTILKNNTTLISVTTTLVSVNGNMIATGELTAYSI